jgi:RNA 2',3'-cyclic 3'-phosphodiesterase
MRLFFALWPDELVRANLARQRIDLARASGGRPTRPATLHVTLVYLGEVLPDQIHDAISVGQSIFQPPFEYKIDLAGCYTSANIAWMGSEETPMELFILQETLLAAANKIGFKTDPRTFRPHITVARNVTTPFASTEVSSTIWQINSFSLIESRSTSVGPTYDIIETWPLNSQ